jgi:hypothetical protein
MGVEVAAVRARRMVLVVLATFGLVAVSSAWAREPPLSVPLSRLRAALFCQQSVMHATRPPVLLVTGTGIDGSEVWPQGLQVSLTRAGIPSCYLNFPHHTTGDMQIAVQYLVYALRTVHREAGREITVYGVSQGGLLPRFALLYWASLRRMVSDVVLVAGTQHGTTAFGPLFAGCTPRCRFTAAVWQQAAGSGLLRAINRPGRDPTPSPTAWTTVRSLTDELAQPTSGPHPTSALSGASNLVIQNICHGRQTTHVATSVDSVSYATLIDAITHRGPAKAARISRRVCRHLYAPGLNPQRTAASIGAVLALATSRTLDGTDGGILLSREPGVRMAGRFART